MKSALNIIQSDYSARISDEQGLTISCLMEGRLLYKKCYKNNSAHQVPGNLMKPDI